MIGRLAGPPTLSTSPAAPQVNAGTSLAADEANRLPALRSYPPPPGSGEMAPQRQDGTRAPASTQSCPGRLVLGRIEYAKRVARITDPDLPATFTNTEAERRGVSRRRLQQMLATGLIERIGHGLYRRTDAEPVDYDLIEIAVKAQRSTLCLISALARHELTDIIPSAHDVAVPRGAWQPLVSAPVHWHKFDVSTFEIGRGQIRLDETHTIGLYDAPRSIADAFRLRHKVGPDVANEALRRWLRHGGKPADLMRMTKAFPAARPAVLHTLQVLL